MILGSLPGERSLAAGRYYAHPQNRFWQLVGEAIEADLPALERDDIASARREGSLDTAIREAAHNPLRELTGGLPDLRAVAFNGATAAKIGTQLLASASLELVPLPSSSPAYASMPLAEKQRCWNSLRKHLG